MKRSTLRGGFCASDSNICGTGSRSSPCRRMSATTPTTVNHGRSESRGPNLNLLPTGSRPGHERRAIASLMIATRGASGPSPIEKKRPRSNGVPSGLEEIRADLVSSEPQALGNRSVVAFGREDLFPGVADEQIADDAGALHTGNRLNLFEHAVVKIGPLRGDVEARRGGELHRKDPLGPESRIDALTCHQLRTSRPAPTSRTIASANSATTSARRIPRVAAPPETLLPPSSPEGRKSRRNAVIAGASPTRIPARREMARAQPSTRRSRLTSFRRGRLPGAKARMRRMPAKASSVPISPETAASRTLSVSNCRTIRPALAPSAARTAISRARATLRASERLATLAAAMRNTQNTAPPSIHNANRDWDPTM